MAKITISRLFETSKYLTTKAGQELKDALIYISEFVEVTTRALSNGLTFVDNFDSLEKTVVVREATETVVYTGGQKRVKEVVVRRSLDGDYYDISSFGWKYNAEGNVIIKVGFSGVPENTIPIKLVIMIHFG